MKKNEIENQKEKSFKFSDWIMQGIFRKIGVFLIILLIILIFFGGFRLGKFLSHNSITEEKTQITNSLLYQQLEEINELTTVKYFYTNMGKYENNIQLGNTTIPFTKKSFIISYDGTIKAGIDISKVEINIEKNTILISIPKAEILSHEIDTDSVQVYDEKNTIFNGLHVEDITNFQKEQMEEMEEKARNSGILEEAEENAKRSLKALYEGILKNGDYEEDYILKFTAAKSS